jgi:hypothetical protein
MSFKCEFCNSNFHANFSLLYHQRTAKYCLKLQGIDKTKYICSYCNKNLSEKRLLDAHENKCGLPEKIKLQQHIILQKDTEICILHEKNICLQTQLDMLKDQIYKLESSLINIAIQRIDKTEHSSSSSDSEN